MVREVPVPVPVTKEWPAFSNVIFDLDKSDIRPIEADKIRAVADFMQQNPKFVVGLAGYADPRGSDGHNMKLSEQRTKAVAEALAAAGVSNDRVRQGAFGDKNRNCTENTEECFTRNRRVEFYFQPGQ
jgi:outer membrane protein OmpA-like peptidoglycan-associated protein